MAASTRDVSRAHSVFSETDGARTAVMRRNKPHKQSYKTETIHVKEPKKKLEIIVTHDSAPTGYQFLPMGTPDLARRCKELSRQRSFPVYDVHSTPASREALSSGKVSHYIHSIGYHFRGELIEQACELEGYVVRGQGKALQYVKSSELEQQRQQNTVNRIMMRHGVRPNQQVEETPEKVGSMIREAYPNIPQDELEEIVRHSWAPGTQRIGNMRHIDLPRRVGLAVLSSIRHNHTDYDTLLRIQTEWKEARRLVQPVCLQVLLEWRGDLGPAQDYAMLEELEEELEETVREIIVIDDDDDHVADTVDNDSVPFTTKAEQDRIDGTSNEINHQALTPEEYGADARRTTQEINSVIRDFRSTGWNPFSARSREERENAERQRRRGQLFDQVLGTEYDSFGRTVRREPEVRQRSMSSRLSDSPQSMSSTPRIHQRRYRSAEVSSFTPSPYERPHPSIEPGGGGRYPNSGPTPLYVQDPGHVTYRLRPVTPESERAAKRRRIVSPTHQQQYHDFRYQPTHQQGYGLQAPVQAVHGGQQYSMLQPRPLSVYGPRYPAAAVEPGPSGGYDPTRPILISSDSPPRPPIMRRQDQNDGSRLVARAEAEVHNWPQVPQYGTLPLPTRPAPAYMLVHGGAAPVQQMPRY